MSLQFAIHLCSKNHLDIDILSIDDFYGKYGRKTIKNIPLGTSFLVYIEDKEATHSHVFLVTRGRDIRPKIPIQNYLKTLATYQSPEDWEKPAIAIEKKRRKPLTVK